MGIDACIHGASVGVVSHVHGARVCGGSLAWQVDDFKMAMASGCDGRQGQPKRSRMMRKGGASERLAEDAAQRAQRQQR